MAPPARGAEDACVLMGKALAAPPTSGGGDACVCVRGKRPSLPPRVRERTHVRLWMRKSVRDSPHGERGDIYISVGTPVDKDDTHVGCSES